MKTITITIVKIMMMMILTMIKMLMIMISIMTMSMTKKDSDDNNIIKYLCKVRICNDPKASKINAEQKNQSLQKCTYKGKF